MTDPRIYNYALWAAKWSCLYNYISSTAGIFSCSDDRGLESLLKQGWRCWKWWTGGGCGWSHGCIGHVTLDCLVRQFHTSLAGHLKRKVQRETVTKLYMVKFLKMVIFPFILVVSKQQNSPHCSEELILISHFNSQSDYTCHFEGRSVFQFAFLSFFSYKEWRCLAYIRSGFLESSGTKWIMII